MKILNTLGIASSDVPLGNIVWVDTVNGVDGLAVRGRLTIPFRTLAAAQGAAIAGDTVMVLPGTYLAENLGKHGCNWHFMPGAIVNKVSSSNPLFQAASTNIAYTVSGEGEFNSDSVGPVLRVSGTSADVRFTCKQCRGTSASAASVIEVTAQSIVLLKADSIVSEAPSSGVKVTGSGANVEIRARQIDAFFGVTALEVSGGIVSCWIDRIDGGSSDAVLISGGATILRVDEIQGGSAGIRCSGDVSASLEVWGSRVVASSTANGAIDVVGPSTTVLAIKLYDCLLYSGSTATAGIRGITVGSAPLPTIKCYRTISINKATPNLSQNVPAPTVYGGIYYSIT